mmetsp:Transcript_65046/g.152230  ORF Transcript_65046/g.152230 Transcript_65046/m.152230 type:complete len:100 (-) Transcript_65046:222-521(-)
MVKVEREREKEMLHKQMLVHKQGYMVPPMVVPMVAKEGHMVSPMVVPLVAKEGYMVAKEAYMVAKEHRKKRSGMKRMTIVVQFVLSLVQSGSSPTSQGR